MAKAGKTDLEKKMEAEEEEEKRRKALQKEKEEQRVLLNRWKVSPPDGHACQTRTAPVACSILKSVAQCGPALGPVE